MNCDLIIYLCDVLLILFIIQRQLKSLLYNIVLKTDVRLPLRHMTADINHLTIKVSVDLLVSSYSRCHPRQSDRDILHGSLIVANCFTLHQRWNLDSLARWWQLGNSSCGFHEPPRVNLSLIPTSVDFQWLPRRTSEGLHNLDPIYHAGLDTSHASSIPHLPQSSESYILYPPDKLLLLNMMISFLTMS